MPKNHNLMKQPIIEKVIAQTLQRSNNRHWIFMAAAAMRNIPDNRVILSKGKDNKDFNDDIEQIVDAAEADGFPWVHEYALCRKTEYVQQTPATACQAWNFARNLRYMIKTDQTCMILWDDKMITISWSQINRIIQALHDIPDKEFYACQLAIRGHEEDINLEPLTNLQRKEHSEQIFETVTEGRPIEDFAKIFFKHGIAGYDESFVLSPKGAQWILNALAGSRDFYTFIDHFIRVELPYHAEKSLELKQGIYCPTEMGYQFVKEIMPLGSTTEWAHENSEHYESSRNKIELNLVDVDAEEPETGDDADVL